MKIRTQEYFYTDTRKRGIPSVRIQIISHHLVTFALELMFLSLVIYQKKTCVTAKDFCHL